MYANLYEKIVKGEEKISLVGLGYVGMPIAVAFAKKVKVVGYDLNKAKIELYKSGIDPTNEVGNEAIKNSTVDFTSDETKIREAKFHIVAVPTLILFRQGEILWRDSGIIAYDKLCNTIRRHNINFYR